MDSGCVLIVDDELTNLIVLRAMLEHFGSEVEECSDAASALVRLKKETFTRLLVDIHMPGMTGIDLIRAMRASPGPNRHLPVVAVTADTSLTLQDLRDAGFDDLVHKPISLSLIRHALSIAPTR